MKYFVDTSLIIDYTTKSAKHHQDAKIKLEPLLKDNNVSLIINELVELESLRTIKLSNNPEFEKIKLVLEMFTKFEVKREIYDKAIVFSRYCKSKGFSLRGKCEAIDFIHFITAKHYGLEMLTSDGGFKTLELHFVEHLKLLNEKN